MVYGPAAVRFALEPWQLQETANTIKSLTALQDVNIELDGTTLALISSSRNFDGCVFQFAKIAAHIRSRGGKISFKEGM